jgi:hypothetical protein
MFENLKAGDTIKIGGKEFNVTGHLHIKNRNSELGLQNGIYIKSVPYHCLEFLGAEVVRKAPPKFTPVKWPNFAQVNCYGVSNGEISSDGRLGVLHGFEIIWVKNWEVLDVEK